MDLLSEPGLIILAQPSVVLAVNISKKLRTRVRYIDSSHDVNMSHMTLILQTVLLFFSKNLQRGRQQQRDVNY